MPLRLIVLLRTKWKVPLVNTYHAAIKTQSFSIDVAQEPNVLLEVFDGQSHEYHLSCSADVSVPLTLQVTVHDYAHVTVTWLQKTAVTATITAKIVLAGKQAQATVMIRCVTDHQKKIDATLEVVHQAPETKSMCDVKGVAYHASQFAFKGHVLLSAAALHAHANMHHKHLVVGSRAKVTSCPQLEALHHTVQCGHGSAISYIDDDQLFYLSSRGLNETQARAMIIDSFLS